MNKNYSVNNNGKYLFITRLVDNKTYYTNYNAKLVEIFKSSVIKTAWSNGKHNGNYLKFNVMTNDGITSLYFHHIVFCFYYRGLTVENASTVFTKFKHELSNKCIDHLDDNPHNNCKCNLSLMTRAENSQKTNTNRRFKSYFKLDKAYDGTNYILRFVYLSRPRRHIRQLMSVYYTCHTPRELIDRIKYLKANKWNIRERREGEPLDNDDYYTVKVFPNIEYISTDKSAVDIQNLLIERGESLF